MGAVIQDIIGSAELSRRSATGILIMMIIATLGCGGGVQPTESSVPGIAAPREVSFPTQDGGIVYADVYGHGSSGVVLAHGGRFTKESWAAQGAVLADAGFRVVAIDFRGRGQSRGGSEWKDIHDDRGVEFDVLAAVRYLQESGAQRVSIVGASFGGWATAKASVVADPGAIDRIVLLAASAIEEPERMEGRKLFITTQGDFSGGGILRLPSIRDQFDRASDPKRLVILEGDAHAQFVFETDQGERLMREILDFLSEP